MSCPSAQERQMPSAWRIEHGTEDRKREAAFSLGAAGGPCEVASRTERQGTKGRLTQSARSTPAMAGLPRAPPQNGLLGFAKL